MCNSSNKTFVFDNFKLHDTGCSGLVHWDDPEGWCGEGGGKRASGWVTRVHLW